MVVCLLLSPYANGDDGMKTEWGGKSSSSGSVRTSHRKSFWVRNKKFFVTSFITVWKSSIVRFDKKPPWKLVKNSQHWGSISLSVWRGLEIFSNQRKRKMAIGNSAKESHNRTPIVNTALMEEMILAFVYTFAPLALPIATVTAPRLLCSASKKKRNFFFSLWSRFYRCAVRSFTFIFNFKVFSSIFPDFPFIFPLARWTALRNGSPTRSCSPSYTATLLPLAFPSLSLLWRVISFFWYEPRNNKSMFILLNLVVARLFFFSFLFAQTSSIFEWKRIWHKKSEGKSWSWSGGGG